MVEVPTEEDAKIFAFGRTAEIVEEADGKTHTWTLVGSTEADLKEGRLSAESPVGRALMDSAVGEAVKIETPRGERTYKVQKVLSQ